MNAAVPGPVSILCFSSSLGGLELSTVRLAAGLRARGIEASIITLPESPLSVRADKAGVPVIPIQRKRTYGSLATARRIAGAVRQLSIESLIIMQSRDINHAVLARWFGSSVRIVYYQQMQSGVKKKDFLHSYMFRRLDHWAVLTERMKLETLATTRILPKKVSVVALGYDESRFDPNRWDSASAKEEFGFPASLPVVAVLGRLDPQKGQEEFLRAIAQIGNVIVPVIAGEETKGERGHASRLHELARELGLESRVRFLPFTDEAPKFMAALDIFVLPSYSETYGIVVLEAMAMGKPVVATNAGGVPELVRDEIDGVLVPPRDVSALRKAIERLVVDEQLRRRYGEQARRRAVELFTMSGCIDRIIELLRSLHS